MLNVILIFGILFNLAVGFLLIAKVEPIVWGARGIIIPKKTVIRDAAFLEWDHAKLYLPAAWEEVKEE